MKTLCNALLEIKKKNPEMLVTLKTERYGMFWSGKAKFAPLAITFEAGRKEVKLVENRQFDVALTI